MAPFPLQQSMLDLTLSFESGMAASAAPSFEDLVERHKRLVFRTAWRMMGSQADAEDIAQEVFLKLHARLGEFEKQEQPGAWLYRVTVNQCLDQIRRRRPEKDVEEIHLASQKRGPEEWLILEDRLARLARWIPRLAPGERAALVLRDLEGLSTREVGEILGVSEETVRTSIHRAKEKLRQWMS